MSLTNIMLLFPDSISSLTSAEQILPEYKYTILSELGVGGYRQTLSSVKQWRSVS